ncbi:MAG: DUF721 domain-containing protein [Deltaproteobacteria bacterium]|nr:DUF721 domain-containing protein [Deltaproteobacteria bacterium]
MRDSDRGHVRAAPQSRARVSLRRPVAASAILKPLLKKHGLDKQLARYEFVTRWREIVGEEISKRSRPAYFRGNVLVVQVSSSVWAQELGFYKHVILNRIRKHVRDGQIVDDLAFCVNGDGY